MEPDEQLVTETWSPPASKPYSRPKYFLNWPKSGDGPATSLIPGHQQCHQYGLCQEYLNQLFLLKMAHPDTSPVKKLSLCPVILRPPCLSAKAQRATADHPVNPPHFPGAVSSCAPSKCRQTSVLVAALGIDYISRERCVTTPASVDETWRSEAVGGSAV